jgi:dipeptidyl aminopeptidase/acylaminoacyl peptidase
LKPGRRVRLVAAAIALLATGAPADDAADRAALAAIVAGERARSSAPRFERDDFLVAPPLRQLRLSPDGSRVAWLERVGGADATRSPLELRVASTAPGDGAPRRLLANAPEAELLWSADGQWLFLVEAERVQRVAADGDGGSGVVVALGRELGELVGLDRSRPAALLVAEPVRGGAAYRLARVSAAGASESLFESPQPIADAALDGSGAALYLRLRDGDRYRLGRVENGAFRELASCERLARCEVLGVAADGGAAWLRGNLGGDLVALQRLDAAGALATVAVDPEGVADLDEVVFGGDGAPIVAHFRSRGPRAVALGNRGAARPLAALAKRLAGSDLRLQVGASGPWLVEEREARLQLPRFHLFDPVTGAIRPFLAERLDVARRLPETALARQHAVSWRASDGRRLHGFLSLPPGADPRRVALVAHVHGGPWNHVAPGFDPVVQLLAQRGVAVFQPNFRGSTGFGRDYLLAAGGDFGAGRVHRDIADGVRHLLANGVGDPERVGILGASFGGYSALVALTHEPGLFRAGVALAPPPDFGWTMRYMVERDRSSPAAMPLATSLRFLGIDPGDDALFERLRRESPGAGVERMRRPLLLAAGGRDERVALRAVVDYAARLSAAGADVALYVAPEEGHSIDDRGERRAVLALVERMLHAHLGAAAPSPLPVELETTIARNLRLDGGLLAGGVPAPAGAPPRSGARP